MLVERIEEHESRRKVRGPISEGGEIDVIQKTPGSVAAETNGRRMSMAVTMRERCGIADPGVDSV